MSYALIKEADNKMQKAGCIPYYMSHDAQDNPKGPNEPVMMFMVSSDPSFGGPDPMLAKGGVDSGEDVEHAAVREAEEELGLKRSNIIQDTLKKVWSGELSGLESKYTMHIYVCHVDDTKDFDEPGYETKKVEWLTLSEFNRIGRKSQRHIVEAAAKFISNLPKA